MFIHSTGMSHTFVHFITLNNLFLLLVFHFLFLRHPRPYFVCVKVSPFVDVLFFLCFTVHLNDDKNEDIKVNSELLKSSNIHLRCYTLHDSPSLLVFFETLFIVLWRILEGNLHRNFYVVCSFQLF